MKLGRRGFVASLLAGVSVSRAPAATTGKLGIPGPYRGRVVAVEHPGSIVSGQYQAAAVRQMMDQGMMQLTGAPTATEAWRAFFEPGEVVGIKVNPVGQPYLISAPEVLHAIIDGLKSAGIQARDMVVYDRYRREFLGAGFDKWLPEGVRWTFATEVSQEYQLDMDGYDADHYMEMALVSSRGDPQDRHQRRSYVAKFLTKQIDKLVNLCVLKHHQSAGVTLALKNLSHGLVNNVSRSHISRSLNVCGAFIPAVVEVPIIRRKVVLNILDGIQGAYHGGPGRKVGKYLWDHKTMYFSTDPVAMDKVCWQVIDEQRGRKGMLPVADAKPDDDSIFVSMQPEHIELAGVLGLGEYNDDKIDLKRIKI